MKPSVYLKVFVQFCTSRKYCLAQKAIHAMLQSHCRRDQLALASFIRDGWMYLRNISAEFLESQKYVITAGFFCLFVFF